MTHCPFCTHKLIIKNTNNLRNYLGCPNKHYNFHDLSRIDENVCYQEEVIFKNEYTLIMNGPTDDYFYIKLINQQRDGEITVHQLVYIKPFIISYDLKQLKQKLDTMITFQ